MNRVHMKVTNAASSKGTAWTSWISDVPTTTVILLDLPTNCTAQSLASFLRPHTTVKALEKLPDGTIAFAELATLEDAKTLVQKEGNAALQLEPGVPVRVHFSRYALLQKTASSESGVVLRMEFVLNSPCEQQQPTATTMHTLLQSLDSEAANNLQRLLIGPSLLDILGNYTRVALLEFKEHEYAERLRDPLLGEGVIPAVWGAARVTFSILPMIAVSTSQSNGTGGNLVEAWDFTVHGPLPSGDDASRELERISNDLSQISLRSELSSQIGATTTSSGPAPDAACTPVVFVNHLNMNIFNCDRLFNLVSLYGHVVRIKFIRKRLGVAMVQMDSPHSAHNLLQHLRGLIVFGGNLVVVPSKDQEIWEGGDGLMPLRDGSPSVKNYSDSKSNRFPSVLQAPLVHTATAQRIVPPTSRLHFFNAPPLTTQEMLLHMCLTKSAARPLRVSVSPPRPERKNKCTGMLEFPSVNIAVEALVLLNNIEINCDPYPHPFHFKLAFDARHPPPFSAS